MISFTGAQNGRRSAGQPKIAVRNGLL